jgi:hypothetical protein
MLFFFFFKFKKIDTHSINPLTKNMETIKPLLLVVLLACGKDISARHIMKRADDVYELTPIVQQLSSRVAALESKSTADHNLLCKCL